MFPTNSSNQSSSSWIVHKPVNYQAPTDPTALVKAKTSQFSAVVNSLAGQLPASVQLDQAWLGRVLTVHLANNPGATDPFNIEYRYNPSSGAMLIKHFGLRYGISSLNQKDGRKINWALGASKLTTGKKMTGGSMYRGAWTRLEFSDRNRPHMNIFAKGSVTSPDGSVEAGTFAFIPRMRKSMLTAGKKIHPQKGVVQEGTWAFNSGVNDGRGGMQFIPSNQTAMGKLRVFRAVFESAISSGQPELLPAKEQIENVLEMDDGNIPESKRPVAQQVLAQLVDGMIEPFARKMIHSGSFEPEVLTKLSETLLVILQALNTAPAAEPPQVKTFLNAGQLEQVLVLLKAGQNMLQNDSGKTRHTKQFVDYLDDKLNQIHRIQSDPMTLEQLPEHTRSDFDVMMAAVRADGEALEFASDELKTDRELVMTSVQNFGWALLFASNELKADRDVVMAAVRQEGWALRFASNEIQNDREVVNAAVQHSWDAIRFASEQLRNDPTMTGSAHRRQH